MSMGGELPTLDLEQQRLQRVFDGHMGGVVWDFSYYERQRGVYVPGLLNSAEDALHIELLDYHKYPEHELKTLRFGLGRLATRASFNNRAYVTHVIENGIHQAFRLLDTQPGIGQLAMLDELGVARH